MRMLVAGIAIVAASVLLAGTNVLAAAVEMPIDATLTLAPAGTPERIWTDEEGIVHIRGQLYTGAIAGDIAGTASSLSNVNIDPTTGSGDLFGSFTIEITQGTFSGRFSGTISGGLSSGEVTGKSADGGIIKVGFTEGPPGTFALSGVILNPKG